MVFENRVLSRIFAPKRDEETGDWRKLRNEKLHNLFSSPSIVRMMGRWEGYLARMEEKRNSYRVLLGMPEGRRSRGRQRRRWVDNIKMDLREVELSAMDCTDLPQDRD
jgi:hypothetical protein